MHKAEVAGRMVLEEERQGDVEAAWPALAVGRQYLHRHCRGGYEVHGAWLLRALLFSGPILSVCSSVCNN